MPVCTACPFCNARLIETAIPSSPRVTCERCGESFAPAAWEPTDATNDEIAPTRVPKGVSKALIFGSLLLLVGLGWFAFSKWGSQQKPLADDQPKTLAVQPPLALKGLRYIPSHANVIAAIQPAAMIAFGDESTKANPRALFASFGLPEEFLATLDRAGVKPEDIEQIIAGITFAPDRLVPGLTLVVVFRNVPPSEETLVKALHGEQKPVADRNIYITRLAGLLASPVSQHTWVFGLSEADLTTRPITDNKRFPTAVQEAMTTRLNPASLAWVVTDQQDWSVASPLLRTPETKKLAAKLARGRGLVAGLHQDNGSKLRLQLDLADAATAAEVRDALQPRLPAAKVLIDGSRVDVESDVKPEEAGKLLRSLFDAAKK